MATRGPDPTIQRRRLRTELRKIREAAGFTQRDVATAMDWSPSKLIRIETGQVGISTNDLRVLLAHYRIDDPAEVERLVELNRSSKERSWWSTYTDLVTPGYETYLGYESSASIIRNFEPMLVPGLLQIEEYAREIISELRGPDRKKIDGLVDLRMERQEILAAEESLELHCILDEAVIRRAVAGPETMRRQLRHLKELAHRPNITIRIVPFSQGWYQRLRVSYVLFEFPEPGDEDVLVVENEHGDMVVREKSPKEYEDVTPTKYLETFFELEQMTPSGAAIELIDKALADMSPMTRKPPAVEDGPNDISEETAS